MGNIQSPKLISALAEQLNYERFSADVYYALATAFDFLNLTGFKAYMHKREAEEREHARKFSDYLADRNATPVLSALPDPKREIPADPMKAGIAGFAAALEHEKTVTARINALAEMAFDENDPATGEFLLWFIHEQVEEEKSLEEILTKFRLAEGNGAAILMLDKELGG